MVSDTGYVTALSGRPSRDLPFEPALGVTFQPFPKIEHGHIFWGAAIHLEVENACDNKDLIMVSLLRDALVHHIPVTIGFEEGSSVEYVILRNDIYYGKEFHETRGYVKSITSYVALEHPSAHRLEAFLIELCSSPLPSEDDAQSFVLLPGHVTQHMSILENALANSLPVSIEYAEDSRVILCASLHPRIEYFFLEKQADGARVCAGEIHELAVYRFGKVWGFDVPDLGVVHLSDGPDEFELFLPLQTTNNETAIAQWSILRYAFEKDLQVKIRYESIPKPIELRQLSPDETLKVIQGVVLNRPES
jgi:hypothetical protein